MAWLAALTNQPDAARVWEARARSATALNPEEERGRAYDLSLMRRWLAEPGAAWETLKPIAGRAASLPNGQLRAFKPYNDALYGESTGYRAYMAKIAGEAK